MKIRFTFKTPDVVEDSVKESGMEFDYNMKELCRKWFEWDEYVTVELDTETGTCVVIPND